MKFLLKLVYYTFLLAADFAFNDWVCLFQVRKLVSLIGFVGLCVLFRVYIVTDFCGVRSMCFAFTGSVCLVFVRHVLLCVLLWLVTCGCKNRK
jgi:hypothetical protein